jgi:hypothetical protein
MCRVLFPHSIIIYWYLSPHSTFVGALFHVLYRRLWMLASVLPLKFISQKQIRLKNPEKVQRPFHTEQKEQLLDTYESSERVGNVLDRKRSRISILLTSTKIAKIPPDKTIVPSRSQWHLQFNRNCLQRLHTTTTHAATPYNWITFSLYEYRKCCKLWIEGPTIHFDTTKQWKILIVFSKNWVTTHTALTATTILKVLF